MSDILTITQPDDWHLHVRDGAILRDVIPHTARRFRRAIIMPNLAQPVVSVQQALAYRERIIEAIPDNSGFEPLMTLYLTDNTEPAEIGRVSQSPFVHAVKYYPAGATTNSDSGVTAIENVYPVLAAMEEHGIPLLMHGETTDPDIDIFDREAVFIDRTLNPLTQRFPELRIVLEHITTQQGADYVREAPSHIAATITAHHLLLNRNALFAGGINPHHYCLPVLKRERHREALIEAATSGNQSFFLGTDSAPHPRNRKESACGCAGIYTAHAALELYIEVFEQAGKIDRLESFASFNGPDFYGLPRNPGRISVTRRDWVVTDELPMGDERLVPFRAGKPVHWTISDNTHE